jgi:hypothetical protein
LGIVIGEQLVELRHPTTSVGISALLLTETVLCFTAARIMPPHKSVTEPDSI